MSKNIKHGNTPISYRTFCPLIPTILNNNRWLPTNENEFTARKQEIMKTTGLFHNDRDCLCLHNGNWPSIHRRTFTMIKIPMAKIFFRPTNPQHSIVHNYPSRIRIFNSNSPFLARSILESTNAFVVNV